MVKFLKYIPILFGLISKFVLWFQKGQLERAKVLLEKHEASKRTLDEVKKIRNKYNTDPDYAKRVREKTTRN